MKEAAGNPPSNQLGAGITEDALKAAVARSGHPMQASVVRQIQKSFAEHWGGDSTRSLLLVQEEWTYEDRDSGEVRALDALAEAHLWRQHSERQPRIRPVLSLLVECKQSELPFVFFTRAEYQLPDFPVTSGFPNSHVTLKTDDDPSSFTFPILNLWGLDESAFIVAPPVAVSLSKVRRKGKELEITGEDSYKSLTLPLVKAVEHLGRTTSFSGEHFTDGRLVVPVAVLRAPMISVHEDSEGDMEAVPWVRVHRYEPARERHSWKSHHLMAFDVVHEAYLAIYLAFLFTFADDFASAIHGHQEVLLAGRGFARGLGRWERPHQVDAISREERL